VTEKRTFWELRNIGMVNWFLFGAKDIRVRGRIALTGPNGAGKSSILDAIQTVLTGKSGRHLQLNSLVQTGSDRSVRRTVRDYCLGTVDDAEDGSTHVRDQAISYLLLGFNRSDINRSVTVGICLAASISQPDEEVLARFIVDGALLGVDDVCRRGTDADGEWTEALPWDEVAAKLRSDPAVELRTESGPEIFVKSLCRALGPEDGVIDPHKFLRNLKNAAAFRPVGNTTDFVRGFILDAHTLNLGDLRESIARYKAVQIRISDLKQRIGEVGELRDRGVKIGVRVRTLVQHRLTLAQGRVHLAASRWASAREERDATASQLADVAASIAAIEQRLQERWEELERARALAAASATALALEEQRHRKRMLEERLAMLRERREPLVGLLTDAAASVPLVEPFSAEAARRLEVLAAGGADGASSPQAVEAVSGLEAGLAAALDAAERQVDAARDTVTALEADLASARANLARIGSGQRVLGRNTQALLRVLSAAGIAATPLCDLVTGVDREWRRTVEAVLGEAREALIVEPAEYEAALKAYRGSGTAGGQVINTTKSEGTRAPRKGSLATVVAAGDRHARAFIDFRLGAIAMVQTEAELRREDSAATADLMLASGRSVRKLRTPDQMLLGLLSAEGAAEEMEAAISDLLTRHTAARHLLDQLRSAQRTISRLASEFGRLDLASVAAVLAEMAQSAPAIAAAEAEIRRLEPAGDGGLRERVAEAEAAWRKAGGERDSANALKATLSERLSGRAEAVRRAQEADTALRADARIVVDANRHIIGEEEEQFALWWLGEPVPGPPDFSRATPWEGEATPGGESDDGGLDGKLKRVDFLIDYHHKRVESERPNFIVRVGSYVNTHGLPRPSFLDDAAGEGVAADLFGAALDWVGREAVSLSSQVLKDYEDKAKAAHDDAVEHFKGDFIGKMRGAFEAIQGRLRELNRQLAKRDFHGLTYRFEKKDAAAYRDMIALVEASSSPDFDLVLGGEAAAGDRVAKAIARLEEIALNPEASIEDLEDPRRYFEFDIAMDKNGVERTTMSKRLATGSGGQVQVPFYVAICAALAATYYPDRHGLDGGLAIAVFDEAFNRMDSAVIKEVVSFMGDVGLQPFIAAPDKERATFIQFVDTVIGLSRTGTSVSVDVQYVKPHTHAEFERENPSLYGFGAFRDGAAGPRADAAE